MRAAPAGLPRTVWALGIVSLCMDASSELVHSLLPLYLAAGLGASMTMIGIVEGVAEATAHIVKVFSGALSDRLGRRKPLLVIGYGLAALTKPVFPLAANVEWVFGARLVDRLGKGIRGAPRDALIADVTPPALRGAAYGLRQALDSVGAFVGPLLAIGLMLLLANDLRAALWFATLPALAAMGVLVFAVVDPGRRAPATGRRLALRDVRALPLPFWGIVLLGAVFTLARFSEAFLVLRGDGLGLGLAFAPAVLVVLGAVYALVAYPAGLVADRLGATGLLAAGLLALVAADLVLASAAGPTAVCAGAALWGAHLGLTQGLLSKLVADTAPPALVGTAFGLFNLACGVALAAASMIAGVLWERFGPAATFHAGAMFAGAACVGVLCVRAARR